MAIGIIAEQLSDDADIRRMLMNFIVSTGSIRSKATKAAENLKTKYDMYYDYNESLKTIPGHRLLAIRRGSKEQVLSWKIIVDDGKAIDMILARVAKNIVQYRAKNGSFKDKKELMKVPLFREKTFTQCAGFLRIAGGINPLDNSAVHPESYPVVEKMAVDLSVDVAELIGNESLIKQIDPKKYVTQDTGLLTLNDIIQELKKPGVDPRKDFSTAQFSDDVNTLEDLKENMILDGTVTNVTNFGAFVDIGVHQDGLVHISKLSSKFVPNPHEIVSVGETLKVKVLKVDAELKRISLEVVGV
ncbi:MAG: S1 RNA-binding domain-containing protein [Endomicrobium sp.]|nr:S1 RNA-binding domain-containing protein [Endomicrobium sp.]